MLSPLDSKVNFFSDNVRSNLGARNELKKFIEFIFRREKISLKSINYVFCTDAMLRKINRLYLNHDYFTDIITFNLTEPGKLIDSEVYISIDRIKENSKNLGVTYKSELHRVIFHGVLHLCGYSDKKQANRLIMRNKEDYYLLRYFGQRFT